MVPRPAVVACTPAALIEATQAPAAAAARSATGARILAATARTVVVGLVVVVAQPEEPHEPHDQQPDIEDAEADHEDPAFGGHTWIVQRTKPLLKARGRYFFLGGVVG